MRERTCHRPNLRVNALRLKNEVKPTTTMTLIVSVIVQDGIILAGDSFTSLLTPGTEPKAIKAFPHAQKIVSFYDRFGIGSWGHASINQKSVTLCIREIEHELRAEGIEFSTVDEVADAVRENLLPLKFQDDNVDEDYFGFNVVGYAGSTAKVIQYEFDAESGPRVDNIVDFGAYPACQMEVVSSIEATYGDDEYPPFNLFSLQNAIDYALFLMRTTIEFQQFSGGVSTVGGDINIAVVTRLEGFRWIQRQPISPVLQGFTGVP